MIKTYFSLLLFILLIVLGRCTQPYFPPQLLFFAGSTLYAIDEINQRAYKSASESIKSSETAYAMKNFPYSIPDSPQSKYYVQLQDKFPDTGCRYGTYWKYGGSNFNAFPAHWSNGSSFEIKSFINFKYEMIRSNKSSVYEDYWYSNKTCHPLGKACPCEEIYFRKGTDIPVRSTQVIRTPWDIQQYTTEYLMIKIGKPDDKYFDPIIKDWAFTCRDVMLGLLYNPNTSKIDLNQSVKIQVWLSSPPHRINETDTVSIQWEAAECTDCFTWIPKQLSFNSKNFHERQILTITRVKGGPKTTLIPIFNGGGFDLVPPHNYTIVFE
ncbi:unnamed protein product [Rotaria sp. Silwood2]|nr:unnamed protein product [Rotaria sp. Silwood2]CAF2968352.1 unnamed protein product [Rotaria sp. Silwood2]CAF3238359.1 unnamed protein product [Rotaria sp. Silwood2]CAF3337410.1 unnamed protein product [Rotaria sp. Silwood2]CAF3997867.1 unnamed protein product [Rotaria sp. Silwood2]